MNRFWKICLINIGIIYVITALCAAVYNNGGVFLFAPLIIAALQLIVAFVLLIPQKTRFISESMFAASGLVILIGLGVCSAYSASI